MPRIPPRCGGAWGCRPARRRWAVVVAAAVAPEDGPMNALRRFYAEEVMAVAGVNRMRRLYQGADVSCSSRSGMASPVSASRKETTSLSSEEVKPSGTIRESFVPTKRLSPPP